MSAQVHTIHSISSPPATAVFLTVYTHVIIIICKHTLDPYPEAVEHQAKSCSICLQPWHLAVVHGGGGLAYIYIYRERERASGEWSEWREWREWRQWREWRGWRERCEWREWREWSEWREWREWLCSRPRWRSILSRWTWSNPHAQQDCAELGTRDGGRHYPVCAQVPLDWKPCQRSRGQPPPPQIDRHAPYRRDDKGFCLPQCGSAPVTDPGPYAGWHARPGSSAGRGSLSGSALS